MDKLQCAAALQQFAWEAIDALTDALQEAVPAKQPLLATSSAHCRLVLTAALVTNSTALLQLVGSSVCWGGLSSQFAFSARLSLLLLLH